MISAGSDLVGHAEVSAEHPIDIPQGWLVNRGAATLWPLEFLGCTILAGLLYLAGSLVSAAHASEDISRLFLGSWRSAGDGGTWRSDGPGILNCHPPSLPGDANEREVVRITPTRIQYPEIGCRIAAVAPTDDESSLALGVALACVGEGYTWHGGQMWRLEAINGELVLITALGPRGAITVFRRCR